MKSLHKTSLRLVFEHLLQKVRHVRCVYLEFPSVNENELLVLQVEIVVHPVSEALFKLNESLYV